ncbi:MAG TPA: hypothetical protein VN836_06025 [Verrucomicrobiae bacterium]|nr:hypothetical protein [Verrucomicrobiae bacterium]
MSSISDVEIDLEKLFLPAWAQESPSANRYAKFAGEPAARDDRPREGRRGGPRREPFGERRGPRPPRSGPKFGDRKEGFARREGRRDDRRPSQRDERAEPLPLPEITVAFLPDERGVESLARQIKMTGRAFPLFQIAQIVLAKPERYSVQLNVTKNADGTVKQPLFVCALDDTPWLSEDEAVAHVLGKHFATFYQAERTAIEPPKGKYTFVAQCGMSGVILGPPNYHDYQNQLRKLHTERFSRMPFEVFKARVKIVRDEAVVKKWVEDQSFRTEYTCLNVPEPLKLPSREEVEKHFRAVHKDAIIKPVETHTVNGVLSRNLRCRELQQLVRNDWERQKYFPLQLATGLSRQFAVHGLQFFKVNRTYTHVSVARPQFLDLETTPVSEGVKRIIAYINAHTKCTRRQLMEALAPAPAVIEIKSEAAPSTAPAEGATPNAPGAAPAKPAGPQSPEPTPEQTAVISDLHWLVHQGHVIEFADGRMDTAKKPLPRPPKPEKKPTEEKPAAEGETTAIAAVPAGEIPVLTEAEIPPSQPEPAIEPEPAAEATAETPASTESATEASATEPAAAVETAPAESAATPAVEPAPAPAIEPAAEDNPSPS